MYICINNTSESNEIEIGKFYELIRHQHPKCTWVKIPQSDSVGYKTIQCYLSDFKNLEQWRDQKIDQILSQ